MEKRMEKQDKAAAQMALPEAEVSRPLWQNGLYFAMMIAILVFANWGKTDDTSGLWYAIYANKWLITSLFSAAMGTCLMLWFHLPKWQVALAAAPPVVMACFSATTRPSLLSPG